MTPEAFISGLTIAVIIGVVVLYALGGGKRGGS